MIKTDEQLISDYLDGSEKALGTLIDRHLTNAYNFALKLVNDSQVADDITQEAFVKAWNNIRGFRQGSSFQTWLFAITRNVAIDWLRRRKELVFSAFENERGENMLTETLVDTGLLPDELLARAEDARFVEILLEEIDPLYRDVLKLRYSSNMTFAEIGEFLKRPLHTVKSQHRRALIALRRSFEARPI
ncbi:MAG: RNA polymerase sigma factor [Candidatus Paceibacterota bacterium]|jgi:RNA polymerase sigma-70 factor (ECF subfamily)